MHDEQHIGDTFKWKYTVLALKWVVLHKHRLMYSNLVCTCVMVENWKIIARWHFAYLHLNCTILHFLHIFGYAKLLVYASYKHVWPLILKLQLSNYIQQWSKSGILSTTYENKVKSQYETGVKNPTHKIQPFPTSSA